MRRIGALGVVFILLGTSVAVPVSLAAKSKVLTVMYGGAPRQKMDTFKRMCQEYDKVDSNVEIKLITGEGLEFWQKVKVLAATGSLPDIMRLDDDWSGEHMVYSVVRDLTPLIKADINRADFFNESWKPFVYKGKTYGVPYDGAAHVMYYNKKLLSEAGVAYPSGPKWTFNDFLRDALKITKDTNGDGKPEIWGASLKNAQIHYATWIWCNGGTLYDTTRTKVTLGEQPEALKTLQWFTDLSLKYNACPKGYYADFVMGKVGFNDDANWLILDLEAQREKGKIDYGITYMPAGSKGSWSRSTFDAWGITRTCKDVDTAWKFIKWMASPKGGQQIICDMGTFTPPNKKVAYSGQYSMSRNTYYDEKFFMDVIENHSHISELVLQGAQIWDAWAKGMNDLWAGKVSVLQAVKKATSLVNPILQREAKFRPFAPW